MDARRASTETATFNVGLRFRKSQAKTLRNLALRLNAQDQDREAIELFDKAAAAAASGEPLIVVCTHPMEAQLMAEAFVRYGVRRPAVEQLSD